MKEIEIILRKIILKTYLLFKKNKIKRDKLELSKSDKILLIRLNKIGDALVITPIIKILKQSIGCEIHVLADNKNHFIFNNDTNVDHTFVFPKNGSEIKELRNNIHTQKYCAVFDLHDDVSTTVSLFIGSLQINNKVGFDKKNKKLFSHIVPYLDPSKNHVVDRYLKFLDYLKIPFDRNSISINYQPITSSLQNADKFIENNYGQNNFLVGINISAGSDARFWGIDRYKKLITYFSNYEVKIVLLCSPIDSGKAEIIKNDNCEIFVDPEFDKFAAIISKIDFLFTPDTSVVHLCSAFHIPMFGIYVKYKTNNVVWYPYNTEHRLIVTEKPNFDELEYENVINELNNFFENIYNGKRNS